MGCHFLLQGILPTQGSDPGIEPRSPTLQADALTSAPPGAPPLEAALKQGSCSSAGKNPPAMRETSVRFLGQEDPLEKGKATHSIILGLPWWLSW